MNQPTGLPVLLKTDRLIDPFVAAGDRACLIGAQNGSFPPIGDHLPGQMGGLWAHPQKLLDGFWCAIATANASDSIAGAAGAASVVWLQGAYRFESFPWGARQWFELPEQGLRIRRTLLVPDGHPALLIDLAIDEIGGQARDVELLFLARSDLRPGWSSFSDPAPDGEDRAVVGPTGAMIVATDPTGTWSVAWGSLDTPVGAGLDPHTECGGPEPAAPRGAAGLQRFRVAIEAGGTATMRLGVYGTSAQEGEARDALRDLLHRADALIAAKQHRLATMLTHARLETPDESLNRSWAWTHCAYDWLVREVPGVGRGLGAGLPDYPWWFSCDAAYALRGALPLGQFAMAAQTLRLLATASEGVNGGSGRIIHELTCTGRVVNRGNTQETPQFVSAVFDTYLWSGDRGLLEDLYPLCRTGVLSWTMGACDRDGDLLPEGYGITEVAGLDAELIDSSVWAHEGLRALGRMATLVGDAATAARCAELAPRLRAAIEERFWVEEEGLYADLIAAPRAVQPRLASMLARSRQEHGSDIGPNAAAMVPLLERMLRQADTSMPDEEAAWLFENWVINAPLEAGLAGRDRAEAVFKRLEGAQFLGPAGVYLNGTARGWAMSIATGALAGAEVAYGRIDQALRLSRLLAGQLEIRMPGAISEMSPDGGCFVQAWSGYGAIYPLACGVFGLFPDAGARHLVLAPQLPTGWPGASLRNTRIGAATFSFELQRTGDEQVVCRVRVDQPGWRVTILPAATSAAGEWVPRTSLSIHAEVAGEIWGLARAAQRAGATIELPADQTVDLRL